MIESRALEIAKKLGQQISDKYIISNKTNHYSCIEECLFDYLLNLQWQHTSWYNLSKVLDVVIEHFDINLKPKKEEKYDYYKDRWLW